MSIKTICLLGSILCWNEPAQADGEGRAHARKQTTVHHQRIAKPRTVYRKRFTSFPDEVQAKRKPDLTVDWGIGTPAISHWWLMEEIPKTLDSMQAMHDSVWFKFKVWAERNVDYTFEDGRWHKR